MARTVSKPLPRLPLFDRLLQGDNPETDRNADRAMYELRNSVRRDLEMLFNTRPRYLPFAPELEELQQSVLSYGLMGLQNQHISTQEHQKQFQIQLETAIRRFEPRFRELSVELMSSQNPLDRTLRLKIHTVLTIDSASESVTYDTLIDPVSGRIEIVDR